MKYPIFQEEYEFLNQDFVSRLLNFFHIFKNNNSFRYCFLFIFELYIFKIHYIYLEPYKEHKNKDCLTVAPQYASTEGSINS